MTEQASPHEPKRIWPPETQSKPGEPFWGGEGAAKTGGEKEGEKPATLHDKVVAATRKVFDPEIPVNIYELGLIYKININEETKRVVVDMTLTSPNCPEAESLPGTVRSEVEKIPEVTSAEVNVVWDPPWDPKKMSEEAKLIMGID